MPNTTPEVAAHFSDMGVLSLANEDGTELGVHLFSCKACGSMIIARMKHWETHEKLDSLVNQ